MPKSNHATDESIPQSLESERAVLGSILLDNGCLKAVGELKAQDFYQQSHHIIYVAILRLRSQNKSVDAITLANELNQAGTLERVGGVSYLASLSDGVPLGDYSLVSNYAETVRIKAQKRGLINLAQNVIAKARNGEEDVSAIASVLQREFTDIAARGAPAVIIRAPEEKAEENPEGDIEDVPDAPEECWAGLTKEYREIVAPSCESSDNYHLMCFLAVVGAALGRSIYSTKGGRHYGNTYTILVGESNWSGKSGAMDRALKLANDAALPIILASDISSGEGLLELIHESILADETKRRAGCLVHIDEFYSTLKKSQYQGSTIIPVLKKAFNTPGILELVRHSKLKIINPPTVSLLAGTEPDDLSDGMSVKDLKSGLGNRMDFTGGRPKELNPHGYMPEFGEFARKINDLSRYWHEVGGTDGKELKFSLKANLMWESFYRGMRKRGIQDTTVANLVSRHRVYVQRWSLIYSWLDVRNEERIQEEHLAPALALADWRLRSLFYVFKGIGKDEWVQEEIKMVGYIRRNGSRIGSHSRMGVEFRKFQRRFHDLGWEKIERRLRYMASDPKQPMTPQDRELIWDYVINPSTGRETRFLCLNE